MKYRVNKTNKISLEEKNHLLKEFVMNLISTFPTLDLKYSELMMKLYNCNFYRIKSKKNYDFATYFYKDKSIYFYNDIAIEAGNENIVHECIYFLQDKRDRKNKLNRIGLCEFGSLKIRGLGLNESAIQYIENKMFSKEDENKDYMQVLLKQIIYLTGENDLVSSTIKSDDRFKEKVMTKFNDETIFYSIENAFDKLFELEQKLIRTKNLKTREKIKIELKDVFVKIQQKMYTRYFEHLISIVGTEEDVQLCLDILEEYQKNILNDGMFFEFNENKINELDKILYDINRRKEREGLIKWKESKILSMLSKLLKLNNSQTNEYNDQFK